MKKVSILLSCFNATELVESYVNSIMHTEISSCATLIAIDFPFSHKDRKFVEKQLARYPDLILVPQEQNIPLYDAWNMAIDLASTEFVGNLNLDDRVSPDYFKAAVDALDEWPADVFSTFSLMTSTIGSPSPDAREQDHIPLDRFSGYKLVEYGLTDLVSQASGRVLKRNVPHCAPVWRRSLHKELGYFDAESFDFGADYEFWLRVAAANKKMIVSRERKTIFYCSNGTASDRLMLPKSAGIIKRWEVAFPPANYKPTHLGQAHDLLHYCLNMNAIFSSQKYYSHLANLDQLGSEFERVRKSLESAPMIKPRSNMPKAIDSANGGGIESNGVPGISSRLLQFKNRHHGERALLLCNGPSLNKVDFSRVDISRFVVVGLNKIFMGFERLGIDPKYIVAVNKKVIEQSTEQYNNLRITKFISNRVDPYLVPESESTFHINTINLPKPHKRFSEDITAYVHEGWTVTHAALQVLYYMGFAEVYIVGMDHRFAQHVTRQENRDSVIKGANIDHFDPRYLGNGQSWDFPDLVNSEVSYRAALEVFNRDGRAIYDCTIDGACTIFPKLPVSMVYASPNLPEAKPLSARGAHRISVICPVYNAARFLSESIESVLTQGIPDLELIIVDDGSTDGSFQIARRWAEQDARIHATRNHRAKGVSGARNTGLELARGEYIAFLDADDRFDVGSLKARLKAFETRPESQLVHSCVRFVDPSGEYLGISLGNEKVLSFLHASGNPAHLNSLMGRTEVLRKFRFAEELTNGEDWLFLATVLRSGVRSYFVDGGGAIYRIHTGSTVLRDISLHELKLQQVIDWVYSDSKEELVDVEFRSGLASPPKAEVLLRRRLSLFLSLLLAGEIEQCRSMISDAKLLPFMNSLQPKYYQAALRVPFARQFLISLDDADKLPGDSREKIAAGETSLNLASVIPNLHKVLCDGKVSAESKKDLFMITQSTNGPSAQERLPISSPVAAQACPNESSVSGEILGEPDPKIVVVIGNGPSAKLLDFDQLRLGHVASVGMNAAYRYWDGIDFRPTYYICMDTVVILSHAERIVELVEEGRIKKFFLRDELKDVHPELTNHKRILWFSMARSRSGLFSTNYITTGSWAIRWMLHEGMQLIATIGIDANYVEQLPESKRMGGDSDLRLEIMTTPKFNPNYFFNDYQREGDKYNVPNDPEYLRAKGGLVHVDALRKAHDDAKRLGYHATILDCSPTSKHGIFPKEHLSAFFRKLRLPLLTSFRSGNDGAVLENNVRVTIANCANPFISSVHILLEGDGAQLEAGIQPSLVDALRSFVSEKKVHIVPIKSRPSYQSMFDYGNTLNAKYVVIANSDIVIPYQTTTDIVVDRYPGDAVVCALTRWNRTERGIFPQGMTTSSPPWPEVSLDNLATQDRNYFSYDTYVLDLPISVPHATAQVLIGSFGCDTALAGIFKVSGTEVRNPCLSYQTIHIDEKPRNYQGESGKSDVVRNTTAFTCALLSRYSASPGISTSLNCLGKLRRTVAWIGHPKAIDIWHSLFRAIGATPWSSASIAPRYQFKKILVSRAGLASCQVAIQTLIEELRNKNVFLEWELTGFDTDVHIVDLLIGHENYKTIGSQLEKYQWQSMIHLDRATSEERSIHFDALLAIRDLLPSDEIDQVVNLSSTVSSKAVPNCGPYSRADAAHYDETDCIAELLCHEHRGSVMIDVGAHHGSALMPFLKLRWKIFAFEPDEKNRQKLLERLARHQNAALVKVDTRAVSNESRKGLSFYRSDESTGISGLSAFHPSHKAEQTVDTVTLTEALVGETISAVDFLKIDTEGHDLFVLKGFPWDRFCPAVIECEFEDSKTVPLGYTFHDLATYLVEKGYTVYVSEWHPIIRYGIRHDWHRLVRYPCELADAKGWGNLLAFRDPIDEAVLVAAVQKVMKINAVPAQKPAPVAPPSTALTVSPGYRVIPGPFRQLAPTAWRYQLPEGKTSNLWVAVFDLSIRAGQAFVGGLTVESDCDMQVRVSLGRAGDTPYEGKPQTVPLRPANALPVRLEHVFSKQHSSLKVQLEVLSLKGKEANLSITKVFAHERPAIPAVALPKFSAAAPIPSSLARTAAPAMKLVLAERCVVRMDQSVNGNHWSAPGRAQGGTVRWAAPGVRATLTVSVKRDRDMLVVVSYDAASAREQLEGVRVEIDGTLAPHDLYRDIDPPCFVVRMPAKRDARAGTTELAFIVPPTAEGSGSTGGTPTGLAVAGVTVLPSHPCNTVRSLLADKPWYQRIGLSAGLSVKALEFPLSHFDGLAYLEANPDVAEAITAGRLSSALKHYRRYGRQEGRRSALALTRNPTIGGLADLFDGLAYLETYPDVAEAVRSAAIPSALDHYQTYGRKEGRKVRMCFDGSVRRGTALDLVQMDATRAAKASVEAVKSQLSKDLAGEVAKLNSHLTKIESAISTLARSADLESAHTEFKKTVADARADIAQLRKDRGAQEAELRRVERAAAQNAERLQEELSAATSQMESNAKAVRQELERNNARESAIVSQLEVVKLGFELAKAKVEMAEVKQGSVQRELEALQKQQATQNSRLTHPNLYAFNVLGYQAFPRQLTMANAGRLAKHWAPLLGLTVQEKELFYLAHRICQIENACLGRLATSIDAVLLRMLVARAAGATQLEVLEIGTLFGLGVIALHEAIAPFFEQVHFTVVDPLAGYYGKEHHDVLTGVPISRAVFDENLRRAGMSGDDVTVIQCLSTDPIAMKQARKRQYGLLVIDGDHRYAGVKHDLESYLGTVAPRGYVILDDYGNPSWPDVKQYVDAEVMGRKDLECVGSEWHTAVFRVVSGS